MGIVAALSWASCSDDDDSGNVPGGDATAAIDLPIEESSPETAYTPESAALENVASPIASSDAFQDCQQENSSFGKMLLVEEVGNKSLTLCTAGFSDNNIFSIPLPENYERFYVGMFLFQKLEEGSYHHAYGVVHVSLGENNDELELQGQCDGFGIVNGGVNSEFDRLIMSNGYVAAVGDKDTKPHYLCPAEQARLISLSDLIQLAIILNEKEEVLLKLSEINLD